MALAKVQSYRQTRTVWLTFGHFCRLFRCPVCPGGIVSSWHDQVDLNIPKLAGILALLLSLIVSRPSLFLTVCDALSNGLVGPTSVVLWSSASSVLWSSRITHATNKRLLVFTLVSFIHHHVGFVSICEFLAFDTKMERSTSALAIDGLLLLIFVDLQIRLFFLPSPIHPSLYISLLYQFDLHIIHGGFDVFVSPGCAFVTFSSRTCAMNAIKQMHHTITMEVRTYCLVEFKSVSYLLQLGGLRAINLHNFFLHFCCQKLAFVCWPLALTKLWTQ